MMCHCKKSGKPDSPERPQFLMFIRGILVALILLLLTVDTAWAQVGMQKCNGTNGQMPCFTPQWLPGTCDKTSAVCNADSDPDGTCTFLPVYDPKTVNPPGSGLISTLINNLQNQLNPLSSSMFQGIST